MYNKYMTKPKEKNTKYNTTQIIKTSIIAIFSIFLYFIFGVRLVFIKNQLEWFHNINIIDDNTITAIFSNNNNTEYVNTLDIIYLLHDTEIYQFNTPDFINKLKNADNCESISKLNTSNYGSIFQLLTISHYQTVNYIFLKILGRTLPILNPFVFIIMPVIFLLNTIKILWTYKYLYNNIILRGFIAFWVFFFGIIFSWIWVPITLFIYPTNERLLSVFLYSHYPKLVQFNWDSIINIIHYHPYFKYVIIILLNLSIIGIYITYTNSNILMVILIAIGIGIINYMKGHTLELPTELSKK